jgi:Leucine Rich repeat
MSVEPVSAPRRRFLRFSVRGLIVLVLVIGAWLGWIVRSARIQREAAMAVAKAGGEVHFDWEWKDGTTLPGGKPWVPEWLVDVFGADYFGHIAHVSFATIGQNAQRRRELNAKVEEMQRELNAEFEEKQRELSELRAQVHGKRASFVGSLTPAEERVIQTVWSRPEPTRIATMDSGPLIPLLKGLNKLSHLDLRGNDLSGESLGFFEELTSLVFLDLGGTVMTGSQFAHLKGLKRLSELHLDSTSISDSDLMNLKPLHQLAHLDLEKTQVSDSGLVHLHGLRKLHTLNLSQTRVTDVGLVHIKGLTNLSELDLSATHVTDAGVKDLQQALPSLSIMR